MWVELVGVHRVRIVCGQMALEINCNGERTLWE